MTRDEIKLVAFIFFALLAGVLVNHFRKHGTTPLPEVAPAQKGWAKPPYVFSSSKEARETRRGGNEER
jgi:hypothetical protein